MLPDPARVLAGDARAAAAATMEAARVVGGDFYDVFRLDAARLCVLIGDVSGKGLAAAMFMTLIKARCQAALLRHDGELHVAMREIEVEVSRENPEAMFVTLLVAVLDLDSGKGEFCNAGHEPGLVLVPGGKVERLESGSPPIGVLAGFGFEVGRFTLARGARLVLFTDGVTEACNPERELYGRGRLLRLLEGSTVDEPQMLVNAVRGDVTVFAAGAEQSDDLAVVVLTWRGA
jgi:serine phosphatase RsbU (regulator of sigma subunit)